MKQTLKALSAFIFTTTLAFVGQVEADTSVQFGIGYRSDDIHWKTKAPDTVRLGTESRLNFKDLEIFTIQGRLKSACGECTYYRIDGQYGWVEDGTLRESEYLGFPANAPRDSSNTICYVNPVVRNSAHRKYVADFNIGIGYPLQQCWCPNLQLIPTIGFAYDTQRIHAKNKNRIQDELLAVEVEELSLSREEHKHSSYRTTWWGPWIGLDFAFCHTECWNLYGEFEFHFTRCRRERNSDIGFKFFDDFHRTRSGYGYNLRVGSLYFFCCNWFLDGHLGYERFTSDKRDDRVLWRSYNIGLDLGYMF